MTMFRLGYVIGSLIFPIFYDLRERYLVARYGRWVKSL